MKYTEENLANCGRKITSALLTAQEYNHVVVVFVVVVDVFVFVSVVFM